MINQVFPEPFSPEKQPVIIHCSEQGGLCILGAIFSGGIGLFLGNTGPWVVALIPTLLGMVLLTVGFGILQIPRLVVHPQNKMITLFQDKRIKLARLRNPWEGQKVQIRFEDVDFVFFYDCRLHKVHQRQIENNGDDGRNFCIVIKPKQGRAHLIYKGLFEPTTHLLARKIARCIDVRLKVLGT